MSVMTNVVVKESARARKGYTSRTLSAAIRHADKSSKVEGTTKWGIKFSKIKNVIYLF